MMFYKTLAHVHKFHQLHCTAMSLFGDDLVDEAPSTPVVEVGQKRKADSTPPPTMTKKTKKEMTPEEAKKREEETPEEAMKREATAAKRKLTREANKAKKEKEDAANKAKQVELLQLLGLLCARLGIKSGRASKVCSVQKRQALAEERVELALSGKPLPDDSKSEDGEPTEEDHETAEIVLRTIGREIGKMAAGAIGKEVARLEAKRVMWAGLKAAARRKNPGMDFGCDLGWVGLYRHFVDEDSYSCLEEIRRRGLMPFHTFELKKPITVETMVRQLVAFVPLIRGSE